MANIGLIEVTVNVTPGHEYVGVIDGTIGPVNVHDGDTIDSPVLVRLRDQRGAFTWTPTDVEGPHKLLFSGWPGQDERAIAVRITDMGVAKRKAGAAS